MMVGVLVFAQMSVAAYACPAMSGAPAEMANSAATADTTAKLPCTDAMAAAAQPAGANSPHDQMDPSSPALCAAHCDYGQQAADHASTPTVQAALLTTLYTLPALTAPIGRARPLVDQPRPDAASSPPLAILHCCFRI